MSSDAPAAQCIADQAEVCSTALPAADAADDYGFLCKPVVASCRTRVLFAWFHVPVREWVCGGD